MFTVEEIEILHKKVKSGADFPQYIKDIQQIGVRSFETWVADSHTTYYGLDNYQTESAPQYQTLEISEQLNLAGFKTRLKIHQQGNSNYLTFCNDCANNGILKWIMDLQAMTCTYFDTKGLKVLVENIPG